MSADLGGHVSSSALGAHQVARAGVAAHLSSPGRRFSSRPRRRRLLLTLSSTWSATPVGGVPAGLDPAAVLGLARSSLRERRRRRGRAEGGTGDVFKVFFQVLQRFVEQIFGDFSGPGQG